MGGCVGFPDGSHKTAKIPGAQFELGENKQGNFDFARLGNFFYVAPNIFMQAAVVRIAPKYFTAKPRCLAYSLGPWTKVVLLDDFHEIAGVNSQNLYSGLSFAHLGSIGRFREKGGAA